MKKHVVNRRQFLRGASGIALGLPFLPSLVTNAAHAQVTFAAPKRFVSLQGWHGGLERSAVLPAMSSGAQTQTILDDYSVRRAPLQRSVNGDRAAISTIGSCSADVLNDALVERMAILHGFTVPWYISHSTAGVLGNYAANCAHSGPETLQFPTPTIDQVMAYSSSFYESLGGVNLRSVHFGGEGSFGFNNPFAQEGDIISSAYHDVWSGYSALYRAPAEAQTPSRRPLLVDAVLEEYRSLRQSNARLSADDRSRLDAHIARLDDLERRLAELPAAECREASVGSPFYNASGDELAALLRLQNEVIALAMICGSTRIATISVDESRFAPQIGDWHANVAHQHTSPDAQQLLHEVHQRVFENCFADLASRLNVEEQPGQTVLDASLIIWQWECSTETHWSNDSTVYVAGRAGGALNSGFVADYRDLSSSGNVDGKMPCGLPHNQFLAQVLRAMGVGANEYQDLPNCGFRLEGSGAPTTGYGLAHHDSSNFTDRMRTLMNNMDAPIPFWGA